MPARSQVLRFRDLPGAPLIGALAAALLALVVVALLGWRNVHELEALAARRAAVNSYTESVVTLRVQLLDLVLSGRTYGITGDSAALAAALRADQAAVESLERMRALGVAANLPDRTPRIEVNLDSASARLQRVRIAGPGGAALALELVREGRGAALVARLTEDLDQAAADADGARATIVARSDEIQRALRLWLPLLAALAILMGGLAIVLLRVQAAARAQDLTRFRAIFDSTFQFIGLLSRDGTLLEANRTALEFGGFSAEGMIGKPFWETPWWSLSPETQAELRRAIARAAGGEFVRYPVDVVGEGGRRLTIDFSIKPVLGVDGNVQFLVPEGRDITDVRAAERALEAAEERWDFALTGSDLGVWDWNAVTDEVFFSDRWKSMLGYAPSEIGNGLAEWSSRVHPDDLAPTLATINEHMEGRTPYYVSIHRMRAKDGRYREILDRGKVVSRAADGTPLRVIGTHQDITEQRQAESVARTLQEQLSALMRFSPTLIAVMDRDGRYVQASESLAAAIGRSIGEVVGRRVEDILPPETAALFRSRLEQVFRTGRAIDVEDSVGNTEGERRYRTVVFPMRDETGVMTAVGTVAINITEAHQALRRLEAALDENRVLQGLLSICAQCKRIHDKEDAQWKPVESYVQSHTAATFSHGLCPSCAAAFMRESGLDPEAP